MKQPAAYLSILGVGLLTVLLDQASKYYMLFVLHLPTRPPVEVTEFFSLVMVWNKGVSFGIFNHPEQAMPLVLVGVALAICCVLLRLALKTAWRWERVGYAMVIGGALGNVIDRFRYGAVVDFLYFHIERWGWPAFNLADASIFLGVCILLIMLLRQPSRP